MSLQERNFFFQVVLSPIFGVFPEKVSCIVGEVSGNVANLVKRQLQTFYTITIN